MRVLHLPNNIASQIGYLVLALRNLGVEARGLVRNNAAIQSGTGLENYVVVSRRRHPLRGVVQTLRWWRAFREAVRWADVVHWHSGGRVVPWDLELRYIASQHKVRLVEFWGSDIRSPDVATSDNPYLAQLLTSGRYAISTSASHSTQRAFARYGFACIAPGPEMPAYVLPDLFPAVFHSEAVLSVAEFEPCYPDPGKERPLVVHVPSNPAIKGTGAVLEAVRRLQESRTFDFRLIHDMPRSEAMALVGQSDIVLDQFVVGSFGLVSLEGMAMGKPAVCYLSPAVLKRLPAELPIVNANPDNLVHVLAGLLDDGPRRRELGRRGRAYVERYHEAQHVARGLVSVYTELLARGGW